MGKLYFGYAACLVVLASLCLAKPPPPSIAQSLSPAEKRQLEREARLVVDLMQNRHESGRLFREIDNHEILSRFLAELDPQSRFLNADDVDFVQQRFGRTLKPVYLLKGDLQPAFEIFDLFAQRAFERIDWIKFRLQGEFDFTTDESLAISRKHAAAAADQAAADQRWMRQLKDELLTEILLGRSPEEATAEVARRYEKMRRHIATLDSLAVRELFFDGLLRSFDPHSGYFSADSTKEFTVEMTGGLAGSGLVLKKENGDCVVAGLLPGGPADLTTDLRPGDILDAFADGDAAWVRTKGRRLREIVALIRGNAGTTLRLAYHHADETQRLEAVLERAQVVSVANRARGAICEVPGKEKGHVRRIGWIYLPMFYATQDDPAAPSATHDVAELISRMRKTGIDGLVMDLRDNGGGALPEALGLSGLFIPEGLVMLSRGLDGKIAQLSATKTADRYPGPLVILTSARTASASEIFAGAMKFHRRALVVGSAATYGKGSVQNYIELARAVQGPAGGLTDWGTLRLTAQRYFLPDGKAVQRNGVAADIVMPMLDPPDFEREEALPHALPAEPVPTPAQAIPASGIQYPVTDSLRLELQHQSAQNMSSLPEWILWQHEQKLYRELFAAKTRSLLLETRRSEWRQVRTQLEAFRAQKRKLAHEQAFPVESVEIAAVQTALNAHRARLAARKTRDGAPLLNRLEQGAFVIETTQGHLRQLQLDQIDFQQFSGDTDSLAAAFASAAKLPATAAELDSILQSLTLLEHKTDQSVIACFSTHLHLTPGTADPAALIKGVEAVLQRMTELEGDLRRPVRGLDVPAREALRITTAWADAIATAPSPATNQPP